MVKKEQYPFICKMFCGRDTINEFFLQTRSYTCRHSCTNVRIRWHKTRRVWRNLVWLTHSSHLEEIIPGDHCVQKTMVWFQQYNSEISLTVMKMLLLPLQFYYSHLMSGTVKLSSLRNPILSASYLFLSILELHGQCSLLSCLLNHYQCISSYCIRQWFWLLLGFVLCFFQASIKFSGVNLNLCFS